MLEGFRNQRMAVSRNEIPDTALGSEALDAATWPAARPPSGG
jgi:hypothetical protein